MTLLNEFLQTFANNISGFRQQFFRTEFPTYDNVQFHPSDMQNSRVTQKPKRIDPVLMAEYKKKRPSNKVKQERYADSPFYLRALLPASRRFYCGRIILFIYFFAIKHPSTLFPAPGVFLFAAIGKNFDAPL